MLGSKAGNLCSMYKDLFFNVKHGKNANDVAKNEIAEAIIKYTQHLRVVRSVDLSNI